MTQWGMLLLCAFIALGVGRATWRKAGHLAFVLIVVVLTVVMVGYLHSTPLDKYIPSIDDSVYATGKPPTVINDPNAATDEDVTGVTAATWATTDHTPLSTSNGGSP